ncbi:hypothetical protein JCM11251_006258 [Rhodosporidiobolus azoricus]
MEHQDTPESLSRHVRNISLDGSSPARSLTSPPASAFLPASFEPQVDKGEEEITTEISLDEPSTTIEAHEEDPSAATGRGVAPRLDATDGVNADEGFEAVSLDDGGHTAERFPTSASSSSPSPAPTSTPPLSPATTAATTAIDPSSSSNISVSPLPAAVEATPTAPSSATVGAPPVAASSTSAELPTSPKPDGATPKKPTKAPTAMQKVMSFTRQRDLPPKSKEEEEKHLKQLAEMRAASKDAEKRRKSANEARAAARSASLASALPAWENAILPNWRAVLHDSSQGRHLRQLWWDGTMPTRWRGRLWALAIGNGIAVPKSAFGKAVERVKGLLEKEAEGAGEEVWMGEVKAEVEEDVEGCLPALKLFQKGGVMHEDLMDLLLAWSVYEKTTPRYAQGLAYPAALLLVNMPPAEAFVSLVNLVQKSFVRSFYSEDDEEEDAYYRVFDTLLADVHPKIYNNFSSQVVRPSLYLRPWLSTLFVRFLQLDLSTRLFDVFLLEGDSFLFRVALVILQILEPRLFNPNSDELAAVFAGSDRGAVAVVRREKGLLTPDGGALEERDGGIRVEIESVYEEMGVTEDRVFALLQAMEWKEETWSRLVERELPEAV